MQARSARAFAAPASAPRVGRTSTARQGVAVKAFELKEPPYKLNALEPHMSEDTLNYHWGKHHRTYVNNMNKQIEGTDKENKDLETIIKESWNGGKPEAVFNNAAQTWNHTFFWEGMAPDAGGEPTGKLADAIKSSFGSFEEFKSQFATAGATQFGSGWAWLNANKDGSLEIDKTPNAVSPLVDGKTPILTMDVWEHAYYLDFQNARATYIDTYLNKLINWDAIAKRYEEATS